MPGSLDRGCESSLALGAVARFFASFDSTTIRDESANA
jgi:hypothetical protein